MDDGYTALRDRPRYVRLHTPVTRRSMAPHHRRRRWFAVLALIAAVVIAAGVVLTSTVSPSAHRVLPRPSSYLGRISTLAGAGPKSMAAQLVVAENNAIDRTRGYTSFVRVAGSQHREVALTFDDGPGPYTPEILRALEHAHVPATFFEVGVLERYFHASTSRMVADGFAIGDHTWAHAPMSHLPPAEQKSQLLEQSSVIGKYGASFPRLFRPPYGYFNDSTLKLLNRYRMLMVLWTVDTSDYRQPGVKAIVQSAVSGARPGAIILLHDAGGDRSETVAALPQIISALKRRGYRMVTVPRLLLDNPAPPHQNLNALTPGVG